MKTLALIVSATALSFSLQSYSQLQMQNTTGAPACISKGHEILADNALVLNWKNTTQNQYRNRAHILGTLVHVMPDHTGHHHYKVRIGAGAKDTIEVIYNEQFGAVPLSAPGAQFEACGDYITSNASSGHAPVSPQGAVIHWVHESTNTQTHDSGFIAINGKTYGVSKTAQ